jgi:nucleoside-diphosphate-sugar epimerase
MSVRALAECVQREADEATNIRPRIEAPPAEGPIPAAPIINIDRIRALGLAPTTPIEESVRETIEFCCAHYRFLSDHRPEER